MALVDVFGYAAKESLRSAGRVKLFETEKAFVSVVLDYMIRHISRDYIRRRPEDARSLPLEFATLAVRVPPLRSIKPSAVHFWHGWPLFSPPLGELYS